MKTLTLITLILPGLVQAQLPSDHFFFLQVYENGELIKKNEDSTFSSKVWADDELLENQCTNPELNCYTVPYGTEFVHYQLTQGDKVMSIHSGFAIEKIDFQQGDYEISKEFEDLFTIKPGPKINLYPKWSDFNTGVQYVKDPTPFLQCMSGIESDFDSGFESWIVDVAVFETTVAVAVQQDGSEDASVIYITGNKGEDWTRLTLNDKEADIADIELTSDNDIYVKVQSGGTRYYYTNTGGEEWTELKQSETMPFEKAGKQHSGEMGITTMTITDAGLEFYIQRITDNKVDQLLTIGSWRPSALWVHNQKDTYLLGPTYLLRSFDMGNTWHYYPLESCDVNNPDGLIVLDDGTILIFGDDGLGFYRIL